MDEEIVSDESNGHDKAAVPERVDFIKPIVKLNGEEGELRYDWNYDSIRVDEDTLLLISDCYFAEERLQQKIFFSGESPVLYTQGGFPAGFQNLG